MKIVISDTSPINYLVLIGKQDLLRKLFVTVIVPQAVLEELSSQAAPAEVRRWVAVLPPWLEIRSPMKSPGPVLYHLDKGEREAIQLAEELEANLIVIDERAGREEALKRNLPVIGTLGILDLAAQHGLLDLPTALAKLKSHNFFMSPALERDLLERDTRRKEQPGS